MAQLTQMLRCRQCGHEWAQKSIAVTPKNCPRCFTTYWNRPNLSGEGRPRSISVLDKT